MTEGLSTHTSLKAVSPNSFWTPGVRASPDELQRTWFGPSVTALSSGHGSPRNPAGSLTYLYLSGHWPQLCTISTELSGPLGGCPPVPPFPQAPLLPHFSLCPGCTAALPDWSTHRCLHTPDSTASSSGRFILEAAVTSTWGLAVRPELTVRGGRPASEYQMAGSVVTAAGWGGGPHPDFLRVPPLQPREAPSPNWHRDSL